MKRLYCLLPDVDSTRRVVDALRQQQYDLRHVRVLAHDPQQLDAAQLPDADLLEESNLLPALERGLKVGGVTGLLAGITALSFPPLGAALGGSAILAGGLLGAGLGAWISSMIGVSLPETQLAHFQEALEAGQILLLLDIPKLRHIEAEALIKQTAPSAEFCDSEAVAL